MDVITEIKQSEIGTILEKEPLEKYNTYKFKGIIKAVVYPNNTLKLIELLNILISQNEKYLILGNGSNVIFKDVYYDGVIIKLDKFNKLEINEDIITVGAGYNLIKLANDLSTEGYSGLEFATGIPGTVGGAVLMNAGAHTGTIEGITNNVTVLTPDFKKETLNNEEIKFEYRGSFLKHVSNYFCLEAEFKLENKDSKDIAIMIDEFRKIRIKNQPLEYPSAGSVFSNPEGLYAGKLIEDLGLKGYQVGGASISRKHANFIVNKGSATASDLLELISYIKKEVKFKYNVELKMEQKIIE